MKTVSLILFAILPVMTVATAVAQNGSPCNEGRDRYQEPRSPYAICLPEIGRMDAFLPHCDLIGYGEQFGNQLAAVGDVDHSGTIDFVVGHQLCHYGPLRFAEELLLYKGVAKSLPESTSGQRIGPTEFNSITSFLASGDWDADSHIDIAVRIQILGDTSFGNTGYEIARLVVFWGNDSGNYSIADTTRLDCGAQMWLSLFRGLGSDVNGDSIDDLLVGQLSGFTNGKVVSLPQMMIYKGHSKKRWGHGEVTRAADWQFWKPEPGLYDALSFLDHDQDGVKDIVYARNGGSDASLSILYGTVGGGLPDTTNVETIALRNSGAGHSLFSDVTGDGVPDLLACSGVANFVKVYVGFKGRRLREQYGSGNDSAQPGNEQWWGKPWATIWLPRKINPNWFGDSDRLFDLGDANRDGIGDIFAFSWPYVMEYNGGEKMDSLADALINITPGTGIGILKCLGNIDGSGRDIIAMTTGNEIRFYTPTKDISSLGISRRLPPGTGKAAVEEQRDADDSQSLLLTAVPNPSRGEVQFIWDGPGLHGPATIVIYDFVGREIARCDAHADDGTAHCAVQHLPAGTYLAQFQCGDHTTSTTVVIR